MSQHWEYFTFDGLKSSDYGIWISGENSFYTPERDVTVVEIPGRNGSLTLDNGRWKNVRIDYPCFMSNDFKEGFDAFKNAILPKLGYLRLEDTYHPTGYRKARFLGGIKPKTGPYNRSAEFTLSFDAWPQFYLFPQGPGVLPESIVITGGGTIDNVPLVSYSKPSVQVYFANPLVYEEKSGSVTIGGKTMTFTNVPYTTSNVRSFTIDSEAKTIKMSIDGVSTDISSYCSGEFFEILPPSTSVSSTGVAQLFIQPRWWSL